MLFLIVSKTRAHFGINSSGVAAVTTKTKSSKKAGIGNLTSSPCCSSPSAIVAVGTVGLNSSVLRSFLFLTNGDNETVPSMECMRPLNNAHIQEQMRHTKHKNKKLSSGMQRN